MWIIPGFRSLFVLFILWTQKCKVDIDLRDTISRSQSRFFFFLSWPVGIGLISIWDLKLTHVYICRPTSSHQLLPVPLSPCLSLWSPPERWLRTTLHRRYHGNWQWLEICGIIEPRPVWLTGLGASPPPLGDRPFLQSHQWHSICVKAPFEGPPGVRFD